MNVLTNTNNTNFTRASDVKIPDVYNRRFKTGKDDLDSVFGGLGFLPGMAFTLAAAPGTGKTSMLIQILELLERTGKKTAYISGEEGIEQLAFTAKRLGVTQVPLANITDIDTICDEIKKNKFDFVVLDSLPALTTKKALNKKQVEEYVATKIIQTAKEQEVVIGTILHFTKTGTYKGSTLLPHSVDANLIMTRNKEDDGLRDVDVTKNRFGSTGFVSFPITETGFDFQAVETERPGSKSNSPSKKDLVLEALGQPKTIQTLVNDTSISSGYMGVLLRELTQEGKIKKNGKGVAAIYSKK